MSKLLIDENPLIVLPSLVTEMGGNVVKAMLLQQIHWLLNQPRSGIDHDGRHWIWKTADEWVEDHFVWLKPDTVRRYLVQLEEEGHIVSTQRIRDQWDNTKYYTMSDRWIGQRDTDSNWDNSPTSMEDNSPTSMEDNNTGSYTETTTETTTKNSSRKADDGAGEVFEFLEQTGVFLNPYMAEQYAELIDEFGAENTIRGIQAAAENSKQHAFKYVAACTRNVAQGTGPAPNGQAATAANVYDTARDLTGLYD